MYWVVKDKMLWAHVFELISIASCTYDYLYEIHHMVSYVGQQTLRWLF